jgi:hypothetical protein
MARHRVDRFHLAAVSLGYPGVDQYSVRGHRGGGVGVEHRHPARPDVDVAQCRRGDAGLDRPTCLDPRRETAVEHGNLVMPGPAQGPPQSGRGLAVAGVVGHDPMPCPHAGDAQRLFEHGRIRQRVAPAVPGRAAQLAIQVQKGGTGDVTGDIAVATRRAAQPPPDVDQRGWVGVGELPSQGRNVNERHDIQ